MDGAPSFPILTVLVLVPVVGALAVALISQRRPELVKLVGLLASVVTGALSDLAARRSSTPATPASSSCRSTTWIEEWGISWHLGVDGISLFLVVLTGVLFPLAILGADPHHDEKPYLAWMLLLEAGVMGTSSASTCSCSSSSSRSCSCRCTSSSAAGATTTASTRR